ncbi:MAG: di-trans,poly-cis-decaprenylcistransferase [Gemmatimonadales bacterium]|nr:di-trans,poly-cis-decaprenylcistransferase [Gemmatimonadales bacterium]NIN11786.1 di-trans,poly-cis-decaprenylcistransferase [Gemmatimonadales bacterium]NIN50342.1 di-trans,poly-cis-decaprenylcistransferase [Gemmatimonadales bacterium]NIP07806.1 di-trans,poly-cis-decaprenylcistransferase [Gemmatimonadales bacterium]NIQ99238.1 di-trans,poly-cis-decaprenylcistransferase [Gemmatimonadales bacterium]
MSGLHVGIIMDGNGRWARAQGKPRWRGHLAGVDSVRDVVRGAPDLGVTTLTLYAFSSDNWKRPRGEVGRLFWLLREYCQRERAELVENGVRLTQIGRRDRIPKSALAELKKTEQATARGRRLHLRLAIDYSARWAISEATKRLARRVEQGRLDCKAISCDTLRRAIANGVPDPDLIIRTAGEQRLSDFLLWEAAYAELYFTSVLWPDFRRGELALALSEFQQRERRFGGVLDAGDAAATAVGQ